MARNLILTPFPARSGYTRSRFPLGLGAPTSVEATVVIHLPSIESEFPGKNNSLGVYSPTLLFITRRIIHQQRFRIDSNQLLKMTWFCYSPNFEL